MAPQALLSWVQCHMHKMEADSLTSFATSYPVLKEVLMPILTFQNVIRFFKSFFHISFINPLYRFQKGLLLNSFLGNTMTQWNFCESKASSDWRRNIQDKTHKNLSDSNYSNSQVTWLKAAQNIFWQHSNFTINTVTVQSSIVPCDSYHIMDPESQGL